MDAVLATAEAILRRHPAPALPLPELLERLRAEGPDPGISPDRLLPLLERYPARFLVLDVWSGPWRPLRDRPGGPPLARDCWVAVASDPPDPTDDDGVAGRMRETVRWLARRLDSRARSELVRWHRLALAEAETRAVLPRRAA